MKFLKRKILYSVNSSHSWVIFSDNWICIYFFFFTAQDIEEGESSRIESFVPHFQQPPPTSTQPAKSAKSHRSSGWKNSKFFSKTMSSGEILRSLKKLSLTSSGSDPGEEPQQSRPRKSKSGQLKKRSSCGNDDQLNDDDRTRSPKSPGGFRPLR